MDIRVLSTRSGLLTATYNTTFTLTDADLPCMAHVFLYSGGNVMGSALCKLDTTTDVPFDDYEYVTSSAYFKHWNTALLNVSGSHTLNLSAIGTGTASSGVCYLVTNTFGHPTSAFDLNHSVNMPTGTWPNPYTFQSGLLLLEIIINGNSASGSTLIPGSLNFLYKKELIGPGAYTSNVNWTAAKNAYLGYEMFPANKLSTIAPMMIG